MAALDNLVVTTALPVIRKSFNASLSELEWIVNAYTLTFAVLLLTGAALGDRFGRKRVFIIGLAIFTAGSAIAALSTEVTQLIVARAIQGVGGAIITPLSLTILSAAVPRERRALALGAWGGIAGLAIAIGPLVGGAIAEGLAWQWIFWLNVPIGLIAIPMASARLTESLRSVDQARPARPGARQRRPARRGLGPDPGERAGLDLTHDRRLVRRSAPSSSSASSRGRPGPPSRCSPSASSARGRSRPRTSSRC